MGDTKCYAEQTSHHPPITNYLVKHPKFKGYGYIGMDATMSGNQVNMNFVGKSYLELFDGTKYQIHFPKFFVSGIMFGRRYINYTDCIKIVDLVNIFILT